MKQPKEAKVARGKWELVAMAPTHDWRPPSVYVVCNQESTPGPSGTLVSGAYEVPLVGYTRSAWCQSWADEVARHFKNANGQALAGCTIHEDRIEAIMKAMACTSEADVDSSEGSSGGD